MAGQVLTARERPAGIRYVIHLDTSKLTAEGEPDPAFVRRYDWSRPPRNAGEGAQAYANRLDAWRQMTRRETRLLALEEAGRVADEGAGTALEDEGAAL